MASLKKRFKEGLKSYKAGVMQTGKMLASVATGGVGAAAAKAKKKKLRAGMMKATGQDPKQAKKIKQRTDIAAKRLSEKRRAAGEKPKYDKKK